jgi:hypothetical protein
MDSEHATMGARTATNNHATRRDALKLALTVPESPIHPSAATWEHVRVSEETDLATRALVDHIRAVFRVGVGWIFEEDRRTALEDVRVVEDAEPGRNGAMIGLPMDPDRAPSAAAVDVGHLETGSGTER